MFFNAILIATVLNVVVTLILLLLFFNVTPTLVVVVVVVIVERMSTCGVRLTGSGLSDLHLAYSEVGIYKRKKVHAILKFVVVFFLVDAVVDSRFLPFFDSVISYFWFLKMCFFGK